MSTSSAGFEVERGDATEIASDLLLVKYAQVPLGLDLKVASLLVSKGVCQENRLRPKPDDFVIVETRGAIAPTSVMFLGTTTIGKLGYRELQRFARRAMEILATRRFGIDHITTTVHGVGFGLDAGESIQHLVQGFKEGFAAWPLTIWIPPVTFVERDERILRIISSALGSANEGSPRSSGAPSEITEEIEVPHQGERARVSVPPPRRVRSVHSPEVAPAQLPSKELIFVAMPYTSEFQDVYEFGIYGPVRRCGYICEKVDEASFAGDILQRIMDRILSAKLVVADLTGARPNVYLEVGYAWGRGVPVVFLAKDGEALHFDVKTHKCIFYKSIGQLARDLEKLVLGMFGQGNAGE